MNALVYYLSLPFLYGVSLLPMWWLYRLSDALYILLYVLLGYRKQVVLMNLRNSFPEKEEGEILDISKKFYQYFCDFIFESLKTLTISEQRLKKLVLFEDTSLFQQFQKEGQSLIVVMGHFGNWELAGSRFSLEPIHTLYVVYHPLKNPYFEKLVYFMRTRHGTRLYPMKGVLRGMIKNKAQTSVTAFIADQAPSYTNTYWTRFLNQDTPIFSGTEKIAAKFNYPIVYITVKRVKRGLYKIIPELLVKDPQSKSPHEISELHTRRLEQDIKDQPEIWLWTHRRWKRKRNIEP